MFEVLSSSSQDMWSSIGHVAFNCLLPTLNIPEIHTNVLLRTSRSQVSLPRLQASELKSRGFILMPPNCLDPSVQSPSFVYDKPGWEPFHGLPLDALLPRAAVA